MTANRSLIAELAIIIGLLLSGAFAASYIASNTSFTVKHVTVYPVDGFLKVIADKLNEKPYNQLLSRVNIEDVTAQDADIVYALHNTKGYVLGAVQFYGRAWSIIGLKQNSFKTKEEAQSELKKYISPDHVWWSENDEDSFLNLSSGHMIHNIFEQDSSKTCLANIKMFGNCFHSSH